jgi:hypothetical protein
MMRRYHKERPTFIYYLASSIFFLSAAPALACSCTSTNREETVANADVVFTGTVEKIEAEGFWNVATLKVDDVEKGTVDEEATVQTAKSSAACGIEFVVGKKMEIAAIQRKQRLHASLCSQMGLGK